MLEFRVLHYASQVLPDKSVQVNNFDIAASVLAVLQVRRASTLDFAHSRTLTPCQSSKRR